MTQTAQIDQVSPEELRRAIGAYCSGVTIISARGPDGRLHGMTCQSFHSLSLDPPLVAYFAGRQSRSYAALRDMEAFSINVLAEGQEELALQFARSGTDKWAGTDWTPDDFGQPLLAGAIATISCARHDVFPGGDHMIHIGRVRAIRRDPALAPLLFFGARFVQLEKTDPAG